MESSISGLGFALPTPHSNQKPSPNSIIEPLGTPLKHGPPKTPSSKAHSTQSSTSDTPSVIFIP